MKRTLDADRPIFLQIKENIEEDILTGLLKPDEQIPSTNQLVSFYNVNPVTVLKGVTLLTDEGIIYKKRGIGMFVSTDAPQLLRSKYRAQFYQDYVKTLAQKAGQLDIGKEELLAMIEEAVGTEGNNGKD